MSKPIIRIHDTQNNEIFDREMTDEEFSLWQKEVSDANEQEYKTQNILAIKNSTRQKLMDLGLTIEEIDSLKI
jgi:hypothetical protein